MQGYIAVQTNITEQKDTADLERFGSKALEKLLETTRYKTSTSSPALKP